jgi:choline dehydrogenase
LLTPDPFPGFSIGLSNCRPTSRGEIMIRSASPFEAPRIAMNAFSTNEDVAEMLDAVKFLRTIASQPAMQSVIEKEILPGEHCVSDADIIDDFRRRSGTVYHPVSTCRMGVDPGAVVDPRLRFNGIAGLRVVDASIMPALVSGNTNAPTIMVAEKGADMILADAKAGQGAAAA